MGEPHSRDEHDWIESDNAVIFEDDERVIYAVEKECRDEDCTGRLNSVEVSGSMPTTWGDLEDLAYGMYEDFYENPRSISYFTLSAAISGDFSAPLPATDYLAAAVDTAVQDAEEERGKRTREELLMRLPDIEDNVTQ